MAYASIEEFVWRYFSLQQTALVDNMLREDRNMDMYNYLHNLHMHSIALSDGVFTGTHQQLMAKRQEIQMQLKSRKNATLTRDIELLEVDVGQIRSVFEWYAVPYWIASYMIDNHEVVLSWRDCYWWGRCALQNPLTHSEIIANLFINAFGASQ